MYNWKTDVLQDPWPDQGPDHGGPWFRRMVEQQIPGNADEFLAMSEKLGITPIWVFNIVQENRPDQWELVEKWADEAGGKLPVQVFELGNEIPHWQTTKELDVYLDRAKPLGQKLRKQHPGTTSAANAWEPVHLWQPSKGGQPERAEGKAWNQALADSGKFYDGIVMHCYLNTWYHKRDNPNFAVPSERARGEYLFAMGDYLPGAIVDYHRSYFDDAPLWLTEFGILGFGVPQGEWGFTLPEFNYAMNWLIEADTARYLSKHYMLQNEPSVIGAVSMKIAQQKVQSASVTWPVGFVYSLLGEATGQADTVHPLELGDSGTFPGYLALRDQEFSNLKGIAIRGDDEYLFIINRGDEARELTTPSGDASTWAMVQVHGGFEDPHAAVDGGHKSVTAGDTVTLPPLSFTRLTKNGEVSDFAKQMIEEFAGKASNAPRNSPAPGAPPASHPDDDMEHMQVGSGTTGKNLVANGDFESRYAMGGGNTLPAGWSEALVDDDAAGDTAAVKLPKNAQMAQGGLWLAAFGAPGEDLLGGVLYQDLDTEAGTSYTLTFHVKAQGNPALEQVLGVSVIADPDGQANTLLDEEVTRPAGTAANATYEEVTHSFTATGDSTRLKFSNKSETSTGADLMLDTVSVTVAEGGDEPQ